jgi:L-rhamnose mutarotase
MRQALQRCGWRRYSLFLDHDGTLFGYFETDGTLADAVDAMQAEPVNGRWQALMAPYFVADETAADRQMRALEEVFHLG